jgi:2-oxoglutarate dehydrogenase E1 component
MHIDDAGLFALLTGENAQFVDERYAAWLDDPAAVPEDWAALFAEVGPTPTPPRKPAFQPASIFGGVSGASEAVFDSAAELEARVVQLINAYRVRGHMAARIDPLDRRAREGHPELQLDFYGLEKHHLDLSFPTSPLHGMPGRARLRDIVDHCRAAYCASIGAEFMNIEDIKQKRWVQAQLESLPSKNALDHDEQLLVLRKLCDAEAFERLLHTRFPGTKRFSLEGAETLVPLIDVLLARASHSGVREVVIGMAHRGRLNLLVNVLEKPARLVVSEFQDSGGTTQGSGDVKYHLGYSSERTFEGKQLHLSLTPNPSHLEAVDPVVEGRVRAKQDRAGDDQRETCMPLLLHGDAAFSGQGLVMETLNLSQLSGYRTGGTIHVIVNNQIGFTTPPAESRSTRYATDIARMLAIPILHVNGEDPAAVAAVAQLAVQWRQRYHRDVVVDMYCYRKHGHNEGDEPSFTQPMMYEAIRRRPTPRAVYATQLVQRGVIRQDEADAILGDSLRDMKAAATDRGATPMAPARVRAVVMKEADPDMALYASGDRSLGVPTAAVATDAASPLKGMWSRHVGGSIDEEAETRVPMPQLKAGLEAIVAVPDGFSPHAKIRRLIAQRREMVAGNRSIDWAVGEAAAFATLLQDGYVVRLSGQDSGRGTFSHRHAVWTDVNDGTDHVPLAALGNFHSIDSSLSEAAVLGFEVGYSYDTPDGLVIWEAQFGDFANGAQIIIDQFIAASEQKWGRLSGLVMLLPHGYEGQGPEHSSARLERFLLQCAQGNMTVANVTTPAQYFHILRRQVVRSARKPMVIMAPKSLLRHPAATSELSELSEGRFLPIIPETQKLDPAAVERVVFCSGKLYYELLSERARRREGRVALVRVEMLHPWPAVQIEAALSSYPSTVERVWCQEEPENMGAWPYVLMRTHRAGRVPRYVGRTEAASPATGSNRVHREQQAQLISAALDVSPA